RPVVLGQGLDADRLVRNARRLPRLPHRPHRLGGDCRPHLQAGARQAARGLLPCGGAQRRPGHSARHRARRIVPDGDRFIASQEAPKRSFFTQLRRENRFPLFLGLPYSSPSSSVSFDFSAESLANTALASSSSSSSLGFSAAGTSRSVRAAGSSVSP